MSDFAVILFWLLITFLFTRWGIANVRRGNDWMAAAFISLAAAYAVLAMTVTMR